MIRSLVVAVLLLLASVAGRSQVATGNYAFGTFDNHGFDSINAGNLNIHFSIPVLNKAGRGLPFYYNLSYDSSVWRQVTLNGLSSWAPVQNLGWRGDTEIATGYLTYSDDTSGFKVNRTTFCTVEKITHWVYHDTVGVSHPFGGSSSDYENSDGTGSAPCGSSQPNFNSFANDRSGFSLSVTDMSTAVLTSASGTRIVAPVSDSGSGTVTDANGNQVSTDGAGNFTDTTGKVVLKVAGNAPNPQTYTYTDATGTSRAVTVSYRTYTLQTHFSCSAVGDYGPLSTSLVDTISLADGQSFYHFSYESTPGYPDAVTGRPASVTLPGGGVIGYTYTGANNGIVCGDGSAAGLTRTMLSDSPNTAWTYTRTGTTMSHTAVVDGLGNNLNYDFVAAIVPSGTQQPGAFFYEVNRNVWNGAASGATALTKATCYNGSANPCTAAAITLPVAQVDTFATLDNLQQSGVTVKYNAYGGQTEIDTYDFGTSGSRGALLTQETFGYGACGPANFVTADVTRDGGGNTLSSKNYCYDETAVTATSSLPSHVAAPGSRGNLTTSKQWVNSSNTSATNTFTYDDTGQVLTSFDGRGNKTSYTYDAATNAFPLKTTYPTPGNNVTISTSTQYDGTTGALSSSTDPNGQITTYKNYDALMRLTEVDYPDGGLTSYTYAATKVTMARLRQAANSITTVADTDGYGRQAQTTLVDPDGNDLITYTYDGNGNIHSVTNPHRSSASSTDGTTTYAYDALGRQTGQTQPDGSTQGWTYSGNTVVVTDEASNQWKRTSDGLGRLTQVMEPTASSKVPSVETNYVYNALKTTITQKGVATEAARVRSFTSDSLGRKSSASTPEAGALSYIYDGNSNLTSLTDARGMITSLAYDTLNRLTDKTYTDGSPGQHYRYDQSVVWMGAQLNTIGRLSKAGTDSDMRVSAAACVGQQHDPNNLTNVNAVAGNPTRCQWTDELYSYDAMGRQIRIGTAPPSEAGWSAHPTYLQYDLAGNLTSLTYPDGRVVTQSWSNASRLQNVVFDNWNGQHVGYTYASKFTYTPAGAQTEVTAGNAVYTHTPYNNRQQLCQTWIQNQQALVDKHYSYGGGDNCLGSNVGNNGNIMQIYDMRNGSRSQAFSYDPLNRLSAFSTSDPTMQPQSYSYDSFGNVNQLGNVNVQHNANNQVSTGGFTYDAAGNLTNLNNGVSNTGYAFNAESKLYSINSGAGYFTYDANGERMRKDTSAGFTEYQYLNGQMIAEKTADGAWSDYIYANGQKIARADSYDTYIHTWGFSPGNQGASWNIAQLNYVIQSGDRLTWRQSQGGNACGGPNLQFGGPPFTSQSYGVLRDTSGQLVNGWTVQNQWAIRSALLDNYAGRTLTTAQVVTDYCTPWTQQWDDYYGDLAIVSTDGTVTPLYFRQAGGSFPNAWNTGQSNFNAIEEKPIVAAAATGAQYNTTYYHGDHLGSARLVTAGEGWPVSASTYYPFGVEASPSADQNHYKYASLERDGDSGLGPLTDHATFRQYSPVMGSWMSPDPYDGSYNAFNPQSLNRYAYVLNNPMNATDASGLQCVWDDGSYDASDDPGTGTGDKCTALGGRYFSPETFGGYQLTNGQYTGTNGGDWSSAPNAVIAASFLAVSASTETNNSWTLNMTRADFIQTLQNAGFHVSSWDNRLYIAASKVRARVGHPGTNMRDSNAHCSVHVVIALGSGVNGVPVSGDSHVDEYNPFTADRGPLGIPMWNLRPHLTEDVGPDLAIQSGTGTWTGNQNCPNR